MPKRDLIKRLTTAATATGKWLFGYHAVNTVDRRSVPVSTIRSEDRETTTSQRKTLVATTRDLRRNYAIAAWAIRQHLDFVSRFTFQALTPDEAFNDRLESLVKWRSQARQWDVARRHNRNTFVRLLEACRTVDGDVGTILISDGHLQAIEADRIAYPTAGGFPVNAPYDGWNLKENHGIHVSDQGMPLHYCICNRDGTQLRYNRMVRSRYFEHLGYFDRFDQLRGISPLASGLNTMIDCYEGFDYALNKAKMHQLFGVFFERESSATANKGDFSYTDSDDGAAPDSATDSYDFSGVPCMKIEGRPGDKMHMLDSQTPSSEFRDFTEFMIQIGLQSLDIPMTFFDSRRSSYSAQRMDLVRYLESCQAKREPLREFLRNITVWDLSRWTVPQGDAPPLLQLPAGMETYDVEFEWVPAGVPWIDPLKEVQADGLAVAYGFTTRDNIARTRYAGTFAKNIKALGREEAQAAEASATLLIGGATNTTTTRDEEEGNPAAGASDGGNPNE